MLSIINPLLETFLVVAEEGSFNRAAIKLYLSSPAIKKQMDQLEKQSGLILLGKSNRGITLTEAGEEMYQYVKKVKQNAIRKIYSIRTKYIASDTIHIANPLYNENKVNEIIFNRLKEANYDLNVSVVPFIPDRNVADELFASISTKFDCIISAECSSKLSEGCSFLPLYDLQIFCSVPVSHHLACRKVITVQDLQQEVFWMPYPELFPTFDKIQKKYFSHTCKKICYYRSRKDVDSSQNEVILSLPYKNMFHSSKKMIPLKISESVKIGIYYPAFCSEKVMKMIEIIKNGAS